MELKGKYLFMGIFLLLLINALGSQAQAGDEEEDDDISPRFHAHPPSEATCSYRRTEGVCRRRSQCRRPTRHRCRIGLDPIVCCLDATTTSTTTTTSRRPRTTTRKAMTTTTRKSVGKPENIETIDLTFPNCGKRSGVEPKTPATSRNEGLSGLFSRRGGLLSSFRNRGDGLKEKVIVGGVEAAEHSWPWMTAIFKQSGSSKRFLCGASLISRRFILTAAHCFDAEKGDINPSEFVAIVGSHKTSLGTEYQVDKVIPHGGYRPRQHYSDLCLLRLRHQVALAASVAPVCLPSDGLRANIVRGQNDVTVTGWGDTSFGGVSSKVLREVKIPIVPLKECNASYWKIAKQNFPQGITNVFICAGIKEGGKDACQGDSGGPMVAKLSDNTWVQLGIVSFGYGCAQPGFPGVYTRLSQFTKWLYENTDLGKG